MLQNREACLASFELLTGNHFYRPAHQIIFNEIQKLHSKGVAIDLLTVTEHLRTIGELERIGGAGYISGIMSVVPSVENVEHYAKILNDKYILRSCISIAHRMADWSYNERMDPDEVVDRCAKDITAVALGNIGIETEGMADALYERHRIIKERGYSGIPTGWEGIDDLLMEGLPIGLPTIITGIPGTGKTAFVIQLLDQMAAKAPVLYFSLEMTKARVWSRRCAMRIWKARLADRDFNETWIANTGVKIDNNPAWKAIVEDETNWHIDDRTRLTFPQITQSIRRFKREHPDLKVVAIDHLGRVQLTKHGGGRQSEREEATISMTDLCKELDIIIIWVIQPDTGFVREHAGRPISTANLDYFTIAGREAGQMLCIVRPEGSDEIKIYITKGRHGGTGGIIKMRFWTQAQTFVEIG